MPAYRVSEQAQADLDGIWLYVAQDISSIDIASALVESISARFWRLACQPYMGRSREMDLGPSLRSFPAGNYTIFSEIEQNKHVYILRVIDSRRDIPTLFPNP